MRLLLTIGSLLFGIALPTVAIAGPESPSARFRGHPQFGNGEYYQWTFENGARLLFVYDAKKEGVYYAKPGATDFESIIRGEKALTVPSSLEPTILSNLHDVTSIRGEGARNTSISLTSASPRLVAIGTGTHDATEKIYLINQDGNAHAAKAISAAKGRKLELSVLGTKHMKGVAKLHGFIKVTEEGSWRSKRKSIGIDFWARENLTAASITHNLDSEGRRIPPHQEGRETTYLPGLTPEPENGGEQDPKGLDSFNPVKPADAKPTSCGTVACEKPQAPEARAEEKKGPADGFTENWTQRFREKPIVGVQVDENVRAEILSTLFQEEAGNVALLGEAGTGKSTEMKAFVSDLANGKGPKELLDYEFIAIDVSKLESGTKYKGEFDDKVQSLFSLALDKKVVLIVDEFHNLRGKGTHSHSSADIFQTLKPYLADGRLRMIGMTTPEEFVEAFGADKPLVERFVVIEKPEPKGDDLIRTVKNWLAAKGKAVPTDDVIREAIRLSEMFQVVGAQPRKVTRLIDRTYGIMKAAGKTTEPATVADLNAGAKGLYRLDPAQFSPEAFKARIETLREKLEAIVGQREAKDILMNLTKMIRAGTADPNRVKLRVTFAGLKGEAKTDLAKLFAEAMGLPYELINMGDYAIPQENMPSPLERIATALDKNSFTVIILDEFEKAPLAVQNTLLDFLLQRSVSVGIRDTVTGRRTTKKVGVVNASVVITTNAGARAKEGSDRDELVEAMVEDRFSEYVAERMDAIVQFKRLTKNELRRAISIYSKKVLEQFKERFRDIKVDIKNFDGFVDSTLEEFTGKKLSTRSILLKVQERIRAKFTDVTQTDGFDSKGAHELDMGVTTETAATDLEDRYKKIESSGQLSQTRLEDLQRILGDATLDTAVKSALMTHAEREWTKGLGCGKVY